MRGSIIKRGKNSYSIVISLGRGLDGKPKQQWITVKGSKKDAEKKRTEILHQLDSGTFIKPGKITMSEYLERWLKDYAKPNLSPRSYERYSGIIYRHITSDIGNIALNALRPEHLQKHYTNMLNNGLSVRTVKYHHAVIHKSLQTAMKWGLLSRNVSDNADIPRVHQKEMQTWNKYEVNRFLEFAEGSPYYVLFHTALFTGMRRSELLGLKWQDVGIDQIYVSRSLHQLKDGTFIFTQPKSEKSRRTVALGPSSLLTLIEHKEKQKLIRISLGLLLDENDLVFGTPEGKPFRPNTITRSWSTIAKKAGLKVIRLHDARHTHASLMLKQGVHPKIVQERLGHSSIQITLDTYSHVAPGLQQAAAKSFEQELKLTEKQETIKSVH